VRKSVKGKEIDQKMSVELEFLRFLKMPPSRNLKRYDSTGLNVRGSANDMIR